MPERYSIESLLLDFQEFLSGLREFNLREVLDTELKEPAGLDEVDTELQGEGLVLDDELDILRKAVPEVPTVLGNLALFEETQMIPAGVASGEIETRFLVVGYIDFDFFHNC